MTDERIYVGDTGVEFILDTKIDLTLATLLQMKVTKPDDTTTSWTATAATASTTEMTYTSTTGDLDLPGKYIYYAYVEFGANSHHSGKSTSFKVWELFK